MTNPKLVKGYLRQKYRMKRKRLKESGASWRLGIVEAAFVSSSGSGGETVIGGGRQSSSGPK